MGDLIMEENRPNDSNAIVSAELLQRVYERVNAERSDKTPIEVQPNGTFLRLRLKKTRTNKR